MLWGVESHVIERFTGAGVAKENISFAKATFSFIASYSPAQLVSNFKNYYGPTMNAFEAAEKNGKAANLQHELEALFNSQNKSTAEDTVSIPANYLQVTVTR
jgi:hypothetical protein